MKIYKDGVYRDMTPEELAQMEAESRRASVEESSRPLTSDEILRIDDFIEAMNITAHMLLDAAEAL